MMKKKIFVAGHKGMVGSAIVRQLQRDAHVDLILRTREELNLFDQAAVFDFFQQQKIDQVYLAAAKVGGIYANNTFPAEFIYENLIIQTNVIHSAYQANVEKLLFLGSSCIYPKDSAQPIKEEYLLTGALESTNRPYALAKISGIELCWSYNRQYGTKYLAVMPTNLFGIGDNYHPDNSHVIPGLIRRAHEYKQMSRNEFAVWGSGRPRREFLFSDDMAEACVYLMNLTDEKDSILFTEYMPPIVNIGSGKDIAISELAELICATVGYDCELVFDNTKPDGTMRKLLDVSRLNDLGWRATTKLQDGLKIAYQDYLKNYDEKI